MPRLARRDTVIAGLPHHVIVRGNNRRNLFSYPSCYRTFLALLCEAGRRFELPLHCTSLMRNHTHLIATPQSAEQLAWCVHRFAQRYARRRNLARESTGKLFEARYVAIPITSERQLAATMPYIELNAVRAGVVALPEDHRWSTYRLHAGLPDVASEVAALWSPHPWWSALAAAAEERGSIYRELTQRRLDAHRATFVPPPRAYELGVERPDRTRVAEAVGDEMRTLPPDENEYVGLEGCGVSPRIASYVGLEGFGTSAERIASRR
jgi:putative transposase